LIPALTRPRLRDNRFTPEDFQAVAAAAKRKEEPVMMTKAMREAVVAKRAAVRPRAPPT
jgi:hypothetical protein